MTTRHAAYIVTLTEDRREDDDEAIRTALRMVAGVLSVEPVPADYQLHIATERIRSQMRDKVTVFLESLLR